MPQNLIDILPIEVDAARSIRALVLWPWARPEECVYPGDDHPATLHFGAHLDGQLIGIVTMLIETCLVDGDDRDWRLRGMATVEAARGAGVGGRLLHRALDEAQSLGAPRLWCNGRTTARRFYERHGMTAVGDEFESPKTGPHFLFIRGFQRDR